MSGTAASQTLERLHVQDPQQLGLQGQRQIPDFVQEESASIGHFEPANFLRDGSGEGSLLVPEQFALQKIEGNGRAIQRHEGASAAPAEIVNGAGYQLLAGSGFSQDQHG